MNAAYERNGQRVSAEDFYAVACDPRRSVAVEACAGAGGAPPPPHQHSRLIACRYDHRESHQRLWRQPLGRVCTSHARRV